MLIRRRDYDIPEETPGMPSQRGRDMDGQVRRQSSLSQGEML